jgi:hypothetical protein
MVQISKAEQSHYSLTLTSTKIRLKSNHKIEKTENWCKSLYIYIYIYIYIYENYAACIVSKQYECKIHFTFLKYRVIIKTDNFNVL